jgi:hypothetical protein
MLAELICHVMEWTDVWYAHPGPGTHAFWWGATKVRSHACDRVVWNTPGRWMVGVWTGPEMDLICLKRCETNKEANQWLSPNAPTVVLATLAALGKATWLRLRNS